jgi:peptidyl-tRNA hydrolase, PTH1 family
MGRSRIEEEPNHRLRLVVGLGNPGIAYQKTRHNAGFRVVESISEKFNISLSKQKYNAIFGRGAIEKVMVVLAKPMAFMNRSGPPIHQLALYYRIRCEDMLVIHDDIDLAFGRLKIKEKGGHGGHNGIRSLMDAFGGGDFVRLRIGVGRSEAKSDVTEHVLGEFYRDELKIFDQVIDRARDAAVTVLEKGAIVGMNLFNSKNFMVDQLNENL